LGFRKIKSSKNREVNLKCIRKDPVRTAQYTHSVSVIKTSQLTFRRLTSTIVDVPHR